MRRFEPVRNARVRFFSPRPREASTDLGPKDRSRTAAHRLESSARAGPGPSGYAHLPLAELATEITAR
jgi:hypothetical protein